MIDPRPGQGRSCRARLARLAAAAGLPALVVAAGVATAQDSRPYDDKLARLAEVMGAVHYLRELCGGSDGQLWRDRMRELLEADGSSALRKARLTRSFNQGYRAYSRTYPTCVPTAQAALAKFIAEGAELADALAKQ